MNYVLCRLVQEALKELTLWSEDLSRCATEAQAVAFDLNAAPVEKQRADKNLRNDAVGTRVVVCEHADHLARVRCLAATLIHQHQRDVKRHRNVARNQAAINAWMDTLQVSNRNELVPLVRRAAEYTRLA